MADKKWRVASPDPAVAERIAAENDISQLQASLLYNRGITEPEEIAAFFDIQSETAIEEPYALADMDRAVERISEAAHNGEKICIFGDYDVDGIVSTVMLFTYLRSLGADVYWKLPSRKEEGYGLSERIIRDIAEQGTKLLITVDNGVSAKAEIALGAQLGMDTVVTDHHAIPPELPDCVVVDPHRIDCPSAFKDLCGAGVAFKLICAMQEDIDAAFEQYGDILALATISDIVPFLHDNRVFVKRGLPMLDNTAIPGLKSLISKTSNKGKLTAYSVAYGISPRINAAGRVGDAEDAVRLLLEEDPEKAAQYADKIIEYNELRRAEEQKISEEAIEKCCSDEKLRNCAVGIVAGEGWETGVVGIIAARLTERFGRPYAVFGISDGKATGSARSLDGFSIYEAFGSCRDILDRFGGHEQAVGMTLSVDKLPELFERVNAWADKKGQMPAVSLNADGYLRPEHLDMTLGGELNELEPFGRGNPQPLFCLKKLTFRGARGLKSGDHSAIELSRDGARFTGLLFGVGPDKLGFAAGDCVDAIVSVGLKEYNGEPELSVIIKDIRRRDFDQDSYFSAVCGAARAARTGEKPAAEISRGDVAAVYRYFRTAVHAEGGVRLAEDFCGVLAADKLFLCVEVLTQLGLVKQTRDGIDFVGSDVRLDLDASPLYKLCGERVEK